MNNAPSTPGAPRFPTFALLFRWRTLGRILVGLAAFATLIALVGTEENWRGKWAWERYKHQLEAQGEKLDWKDYVPPPVPDAQNFAMTPFLAPLFDFYPEGRREGGSLWRDTNGFNRANSLAGALPNLEQTFGGHDPGPTSQQMTDLPRWAAALMGGAAQEAFRQRYGLQGRGWTPPAPPPLAARHPSASPPLVSPPDPWTRSAVEYYERRYGSISPLPPSPAALSGSAAQEAFRRRYGLERQSSAPGPPPALAEQSPAAPPVLPPAPSAGLVRPGWLPPALTRAEAAAEVLRALEKYNPVLEELRSASQRPYARFNIQYDAEYAPAILLPHLGVMKSAASIFQLRACAELALDRTDQAWSDTKMAFYLADTLKDEPFLISKVVQVFIVHLSLQPIWEGLAEHKWSDAQLVEIEQRLGKLDLLADAAMRGERAMHILTAGQLRHHGIPDPEDSHQLPGFVSLFFGGYFYQNQLFIARMCQQFIVPVVDEANQRIYPSRAVANEAAMIKAIASGFHPYRIFAQKLLFGSTGSLPRGITLAETEFAFAQTRVNEAIVACALERYRLAQGQFPDSLEPLCPRFLEKMPHDIITGAPLIYRRTPDGQFILYSVGWNEKDDGGIVVLNQSKVSADLTQGDWVWQYPGPAALPASQTARE